MLWTILCVMTLFVTATDEHKNRKITVCRYLLGNLSPNDLSLHIEYKDPERQHWDILLPCDLADHIFYIQSSHSDD